METTVTIKTRMIEKFIMSEFAQGNLNTKEQVACMLTLIQKKAEYFSRKGWRLYEKCNWY